MWTPFRASAKSRAADRRWVVLDVESSGLDPARDRLLAIAAVAVHHDGERAWIELADSFELLLRQPEDAAPPDKANILVHGIGVGAQRSGVEPAVALRQFEAYAGDAPLIGYHVAFDRRLIERATGAALGRVPNHRWLDLAEVAPVLREDIAARALDEWLNAFGIECLQRHQASADALATAELLLRLWPRLCEEGATSYTALARLASRRRWLR